MGQSVRTVLRANGRSLVACTILVDAQYPSWQPTISPTLLFKYFTRKQYFHCLLAS